MFVILMTTLFNKILRNLMLITLRAYGVKVLLLKTKF